MAKNEYRQLLLNEQFMYAVIKDYFKDLNREANISRQILGMGILNEIENAEVIDSILALKYEKALWNDYGIDSQLSHELIKKWCYCYGKLILNKEYQPWN